MLGYVSEGSIQLGGAGSSLNPRKEMFLYFPLGLSIQLCSTGFKVLNIVFMYVNLECLNGCHRFLGVFVIM